MYMVRCGTWYSSNHKLTFYMFQSVGNGDRLGGEVGHPVLSIVITHLYKVYRLPLQSHTNIQHISSHTKLKFKQKGEDWLVLIS